MIGDLVRGFTAGRRSSKAWQIIIRVTGDTPDIQYLNNLALRFSNEYEVALLYLLMYLEDGPEVRDRILTLFDEGVAANLIQQKDIKDAYIEAKIHYAQQQKQVTVAPADTNQSSHAKIRETYRNEHIAPADIRKPAASSSATIESSSGYSDSPVIRPTFRPPPLEHPAIKSTVAENQQQQTSNVSSLANARLSGINNTELQRMTFSSLLAAGTSGDPEAQFALGVKYEIGDGVEDNCVEAARWYLKSAKQGYGRAQFNLALCYESGLGVNLDWKKAAELFILAANAGVEEAPNRSELLALKVAQQEQLKNIGQ